MHFYQEVGGHIVLLRQNASNHKVVVISVDLVVGFRHVHPKYTGGWVASQGFTPKSEKQWPEPGGMANRHQNQSLVFTQQRALSRG